jgi:hypothetical protein
MGKLAFVAPRTLSELQIAAKLSLLEDIRRAQLFLVVGKGTVFRIIALSSLQQGFAELGATKIWLRFKFRSVMGERAGSTLGALSQWLKSAHLGLSELFYEHLLHSR